MGMRSAGVPGPPPSADETARRDAPGARARLAGAPMLLTATAAQAAEAVGLCVVIAANVIDSVSGNTWTASNAIGLILVEAVVAVGVAWIATGIARRRPWSRTPAVMTQVFTVMIAVWLLEAHRYAWGVPALLLAIAGLTGLLTPSSLRALARQDQD
jgi:hypothetical protein